ncbi:MULTISPECIES: hypothetical protein [Streptomyces]|nr:MULTISPECIES: hypothetical protein [Streptomyces]
MVETRHDGRASLYAPFQRGTVYGAIRAEIWPYHEDEAPTSDAAGTR